MSAGTTAPGRVLVVGTGLVGTSLALALRAAGVEVTLSDPDPGALALAAAMGAGTPARTGTESPGWPGPEVVVVAAPPDATAAVVVEQLAAHPGAVVTDVASVKAPVLGAVREAVRAAGHRAGPGDPCARYVGGHPMAGRERSGPGSAREDLFLGRPWVLCPAAESDPAAVAAVAAMVAAVGAVGTRMEAGAHDAAVAVVSHVPQVAASLVAARLLHADEATLALSGQGLRDTTRVAASDPRLWTEVLAANAAPVRASLEALRDDVEAMIEALAELEAPAAAPAPGRTTSPGEPPAPTTGPGPTRPGSPEQPGGAEVAARSRLGDLLGAGRSGAARIPGKHGRARQAWAVVTVLVADAPGELARLFADVGAAGVNLEELRLDHSPGRPLGLAEVSVDPGAAQHLLASLDAAGWPVHQG